MKFNKKNAIVENDVVVLMALNESCSNSGCPGPNVGSCVSNNSYSGCGC